MHSRRPHFPVYPLIIIALSAAFMLLCRCFPSLAASWRSYFILPVSGVLARLTASFSFPAAEPLALIAAAHTVSGLLCRKFLRRLLRLSALLFALYTVLWYPAYWCGESFSEKASPAQLESLCRQLIDRLNASPLNFSESENPFPSKVARYPEWMRALNISGLYVPFTAETLVDPDIAPAALPFTIHHELMHQQGIADEGAANIAAYRSCRASGGNAADSADLWALRYALSELKRTDESSWRDCVRQMERRLTDVFDSMDGFSMLPESENSLWLRLLGIEEFTASYAALAHWLAIDIARAS